MHPRPSTHHIKQGARGQQRSEKAAGREVCQRSDGIPFHSEVLTITLRATQKQSCPTRETFFKIKENIPFCPSQKSKNAKPSGKKETFHGLERNAQRHWATLQKASPAYVETAVPPTLRRCPPRCCVFGRMRQCGASVIAACCIGYRSAVRRPSHRAAFCTNPPCHFLLVALFGEIQPVSQSPSACFFYSFIPIFLSNRHYTYSRTLCLKQIRTTAHWTPRKRSERLCTILFSNRKHHHMAYSDSCPIQTGVQY